MDKKGSDSRLGRKAASDPPLEIEEWLAAFVLLGVAVCAVVRFCSACIACIGPKRKHKTITRHEQLIAEKAAQPLEEQLAAALKREADLHATLGQVRHRLKQKLQETSIVDAEPTASTRDATSPERTRVAEGMPLVIKPPNAAAEITPPEMPPTTKPHHECTIAAKRTILLHAAALQAVAARAAAEAAAAHAVAAEAAADAASARGAARAAVAAAATPFSHSCADRTAASESAELAAVSARREPSAAEPWWSTPDSPTLEPGLLDEGSWIPLSEFTPIDISEGALKKQMDTQDPLTIRAPDAAELPVPPPALLSATRLPRAHARVPSAGTL